MPVFEKLAYSENNKMKKSIFLFLSIIMIACNQIPKPPGSDLDLELDWILGSWKRTNDKEGQQTFEHWKESSGEKFKTYRGLGYTLQGQDTIFKEEMKLMLFIKENLKTKLRI